MHYTYVLFCKHSSQSGKIFYVGSTDNLENRLQQHRSKNVLTTKNFDIIELAYYEVCVNKTDARKRELQLKTGFGRGYINKRIENYLRELDKRG